MSRKVLVVLGVLVVLWGCGEPVPVPKDHQHTKDTKHQKGEIPGVGRVVVDWQRWQNPPTRIAIGIGGVAAGPAEGALVPYLFLGPERAEDAHLFARAYAPFRARLGRSELVFHGRGRTRPGPVEERMIVEWARRVAAEQAGGRSGGAYGLALSWHRGGSVGSCESVSVFLTGEVWAEACSWGGDEVRGRLQPAAVGRVYGWFDSLAPFQSTRQQSGESEPSRLVFAGRGSGKPGDDDRADVEAFAAALFRELSAKRRGGAPGEETALLLPREPMRTSPPLARLAPKVPPPVPRPEPARTSASSESRPPAATPP